MAQTKPYPGTQAVLRAVSLLKVFTDQRPEWGLTELAQEVGLNKTTAYRLLTALESEGMITRNSQSDGYQLGPAIVMLGGRALRSNDLRAISRPELKALVASVGETASLELLTGHEMLILDEISGGHVMSGGQTIGTRWPSYATSTGKVMLATLDWEEVERILPQPLKPITPKTVTSMESLRRSLDQVRAQGYAVADEELEMGLRAVAAPLYDFDGDAAGVISLAGPTLRLTDQRLPEITELVLSAARRISIRLGAKPD